MPPSVSSLPTPQENTTPPPAKPAPKAATKTPPKIIDKGYVYAHPDSEYSIRLPEAPTAVTLWADDTSRPVPFMDDPPKYGAVGEIAKFKRVDADTGDTFETTVTFVKTGKDFVGTLTEDRMRETAEKEYKDEKLDNKKVSFSTGSETLKWLTVTGFTIDQANNLYYNVTHYISGLESVIMIKVRYNVENQKYQQFYDDITASIKFTGK